MALGGWAPCNDRAGNGEGTKVTPHHLQPCQESCNTEPLRKAEEQRKSMNSRTWVTFTGHIFLHCNQE